LRDDKGSEAQAIRDFNSPRMKAVMALKSAEIALQAKPDDPERQAACTQAQQKLDALTEGRRLAFLAWLHVRGAGHPRE
jgi:hypothetical protein